MAFNPTAPLSYSAALSKSSNPAAANANNPSSHPPNLPSNNTQPRPPRPRSRSPTYTPQTHTTDETLYTLTLLTSPPLQTPLTALRTRYFPRHLNKLPAHLTLFHALPGSQLRDNVIPTLQRVAHHTERFRIATGGVMKMRKGMGIFVSPAHGGRETQAVRRRLLEVWEEGGWLSEQDRAGGGKPHWTVMNKVDDAGAVERAQREAEEGFKGAEGWGEGLGLWRYEKGWWVWQRGFAFVGGEIGEGGR
ncbi:hypothetical protein B0A50_00031 [Salinomyces thailandicus]|uniref:Uncharacterized protein n=1 Tax=Salinomyces thailandicus TaxID=706561 RepID=A0A4U0UEU5_9PEZI|nr:hypothetical protein B0A50_00031 [Salinomyces thailandica]